MRKCLLGLLACTLTLGGLALTQTEAQAGPRYVRGYYRGYYRPYVRPYYRSYGWGVYPRSAGVIVTPPPVYVQPAPVYGPPAAAPGYVPVPVQPVSPGFPVIPQ
jgi:hypothetical protein